MKNPKRKLSERSTMGQPGDDEPSFDPRTWASKPTAEAEPAPAEAGSGPSFDPRSWTSPLSPASAPRAAPKARGPSLDGRKTAALTAIVLILAVGAAFAAWSGRHQPRRWTRTVAQAAQAAPAAPAAASRRALVLASTADLPATLAGAGVSADQARSAMTLIQGAMPNGSGELHAVIFLDPTATGANLVQLELRRSNGSGAVVSRRADGAFAAQPLQPDLKLQIRDVRGEMGTSDFYSAAVAAGVPDSLIHDFAQAFTFDFDFQREIKPGDIFEAVFQQSVNPQGETVGQPALLFVLLTTQSKSVALYQFAPPGGSPGWFDGNGRSIIRSFMRTPVEGARISSTFGMRDHPILGFMKLHKGVDFAAPVGTPIYAAGDGVIQHAEPKELNGNYVEILHDNGWQTIYLHLNAFGPGISPGVRVHQGQVIGEVGTTGRSTGPHLHYEMHINNEPVDPMTVPLQSGPVLAGQVMQSFIAERNRIDALRAQQSG